MDIPVTICLELWRCIVFIIGYASFWTIIGIMISKWNYRKKHYDSEYKAGYLIVDESEKQSTFDEPNTYLKLTKPLRETVSKPYAVFLVQHRREQKDGNEKDCPQK